MWIFPVRRVLFLNLSPMTRGSPLFVPALFCVLRSSYSQHIRRRQEEGYMKTKNAELLVAVALLAVGMTASLVAQGRGAEGPPTTAWRRRRRSRAPWKN